MSRLVLAFLLLLASQTHAAPAEDKLTLECWIYGLIHSPDDSDVVGTAFPFKEVSLGSRWSAIDEERVGYKYESTGEHNAMGPHLAYAAEPEKNHFGFRVPDHPKDLGWFLTMSYVPSEDALEFSVWATNVIDENTGTKYVRLLSYSFHSSPKKGFKAFVPIRGTNVDLTVDCH